MVFLELRCDYTGDDIEETGANRCLSAQNETPQEWAGGSRKSVADAFSQMMEEAQSSGWVNLNNEGLFCPSCIKKYNRQ